MQGSIEEKILKRLFERVNVFKASIGEIDGILGDLESVEKLTQRALLGTLNQAELEVLLSRAEVAFQNQCVAAKSLDERAGALRAVDQALLDEIRAATGQSQIPDGSQLREFVNEALLRAQSGVSIAEEACEKEVCVDLQTALGQLDTAQGDADSATQFMRAARRGPVTLTFSREAAYRLPNVELIHATHPLARWAALGHPSEHSHAFCLALKGSLVLGPGTYVFALSFLESPTGASALRIAGAAAKIGDESASLCEEAEVAKLLGELLGAGQDAHLPWAGQPAPDEFERTLRVVQTTLDGIVYKQNARDREMSNYRHAARREMVAAGYRTSVERNEALLKKYEDENASVFVKSMQAAKVRRAQERKNAFNLSATEVAWVELEKHDIAVVVLTVDGMKG